MLKLLIVGLCFTLTYALQDCDFLGTLHKSGDSFMDSENCNRCMCTNGVVACTLKLCLPSSFSLCHYGNNTYHAGDSFKALDGCNTCGCHGGHIMCTEMFCLPDKPEVVS